MEELISALGQSLSSFCNHLLASCDGLKNWGFGSDSASSTFIYNLNRRISAAGSDLNLLDSMSFGTVSFEELLGHCNEVYKKNQSDVLELEDQLRSYGYIPELEIEDEDEDLASTTVLESKTNDGIGSSPRELSPAKSVFIKSLEDDSLYPNYIMCIRDHVYSFQFLKRLSSKSFIEHSYILMDASLSLKSFGLSEVCLASLAGGGNGELSPPAMSVREPMKCDSHSMHDINETSQAASNSSVANEGESEGCHEPENASKREIQLSKDDYESLPSYMKMLTSWEDLVSAVDKINVGMRKKSGVDYFLQEEIDPFDLGPRSRSYILILVRMKHLAVETIDGSLSYRIL
ncbi:hypothetical protein LINPERHAP1_LOCUS12308 [Linum perenne]